MTGLQIDLARKTYRTAKGGEVTAVENLRFSVGANQFVCILGPSGCGKTTLLNIIAGLDHDYEGRVSHDCEGKRLGYVFQTPRLLPWRSVLDNITLAAGDDAETVVRAMTLLEELGLKGFEHAFPGELSVGMQRRAALARAYAIDPGVLLMDEPFVSLDEATAIRLRAALLALWRKRPATVLFVTHDSREAICLGQRLIVFSGSPARVVADIPVPLKDDERSQPALIEAFRQEKLCAVGGEILSEDNLPAQVRPPRYINGTSGKANS